MRSLPKKTSTEKDARMMSENARRNLKNAGVKNFRAWSEDLNEFSVQPKTQIGYYVIVPGQAKDLSGTYIRDLLKDPGFTLVKKKRMFTDLYGKYNKEIFELMQKRL